MLKGKLLAAASLFDPGPPPAAPGTLWSWGSNGSFRTAQGTDSGNTSAPTQVGSDTDWLLVNSARQFAFVIAIKTAGTLWSWGSNNQGQTGQGTTTGTTNSPTQVGSDTNWDSIATGSATGFAIKTTGTLWAWGDNSLFRTGLGTDTGTTNSPTQVGSDTNWDQVSAGAAWGAALKTAGTLWTWGANNNFRTGRGTDAGTTNSPTQVGSDTNWSQVACGNQSGAALKTTGTLWTWGNNAFGQTGQGTDAGTTNSPTQVGSATNWSQVSMNDNWGAAIRTNGTLWTWGINDSFRTAQGTATGNTSAPTQVGTDTDWEFVVCGENFGFALKTNGTLWTWGSNNSFQTAQGTATGNTTTPTQVGTDTDWGVALPGFACGFAIKE